MCRRNETRAPCNSQEVQHLFFARLCLLFKHNVSKKRNGEKIFNGWANIDGFMLARDRLGAHKTFSRHLSHQDDRFVASSAELKASDDSSRFITDTLTRVLIKSGLMNDSSTQRELPFQRHCLFLSRPFYSLVCFFEQQQQPQLLRW